MDNRSDRRNTTAASVPTSDDNLAVAAAVLGALMIFVLVLRWLPALAASLSGPEPRAYWYLGRASGITAYGLLWLSIVLGLSLSNRLARVWPGGPTVADLHQFTGFLALGFAAVHGLVLLGDQYIGYTLASRRPCRDPPARDRHPQHALTPAPPRTGRGAAAVIAHTAVPADEEAWMSGWPSTTIKCLTDLGVRLVTYVPDKTAARRSVEAR
ncbi:MAG TPA: hypothetical protein VKW09_02235 [bacterium]|nr:hypothetical protein [bacterium]